MVFNSLDRAEFGSCADRKTNLQYRGHSSAAHAQHRGGRVLLAHADVLDGNELARLHSSLELLPDLGNRGLLHATVERRFQDAAPVLDPHTR